MHKIVCLLNDGSFALDTAYFRHQREKIDYQWQGGSPHVGTLFSPALEELLGPARGADAELSQRHRDIARSAQAIYEEAFFHLLQALHARHGLDSIALAGGCAMNSVANGKIMRRSAFRRIYVQSAAGDAGGAIGAAMHVWHTLAGPQPSATPASSSLAGDAISGRTVMDHAYLGPSATDEEIAHLLRACASRLSDAGCRAARITEEEQLCGLTDSAIARGEVVGWFQGRME